jgi:hypothetical protein
LKLKHRIEKLEKLAKNQKIEKLTIHDQCGNRLQGKIIKLPNKNENGITFDGKEYVIAIDISISEFLSLSLKNDQLEESIEFKITPETLFLRKNNIIGGLEFMERCVEQ